MTAKTDIVLTEKVFTRAPYWKDVPDEKWMDWRWQMSHRLNSLDELSAIINLTDSERKALSAQASSVSILPPTSPA